MTCERFAEAISAIVDGEQPGIDPRLVEAHLGRCPDCAAFRRSSEAVRRRLRVHEVGETRDVARRVTSLTAAADRMASRGIPRVLLLVVAIEVIVLSLIDLVGADGDGAAVHDQRHLSAFTIAYGVLLVLVVVRPARARTALPVAGVLAAALAITAVADLGAGRVPLVGEAIHLPELVSVLLIWLLAVPGPRRRRRQSAGPRAERSDRPRLTAIEPEAS